MSLDRDTFIYQDMTIHKGQGCILQGIKYKAKEMDSTLTKERSLRQGDYSWT